MDTTVPESTGQPERAAARPADESPPFFVGRWAAAETACGHAAWEFSEHGLETPGHVVCAFEDVQKTLSGYEITAQCWAEGPPRTHVMKLSWAQSARALLVERGSVRSGGIGRVRRPDAAAR